MERFEFDNVYNRETYAEVFDLLPGLEERVKDVVEKLQVDAENMCDKVNCGFNILGAEVVFDGHKYLTLLHLKK